MPAFIMALWGALAPFLGPLARELLIRLGIAVVTYEALDTSLDWLKAQAVGALLGLPPQVMGVLGLLKVGTAISIVFSAMVARVAAQGLAGATKKFVLK